LSTRSGRDRARPPSVEAVLTELRPATPDIDGPARTAVVREVVDDERRRLTGDGYDGARSAADLADEAAARLAAYGRTGVEPVINATGVIVHTNLGRAPWPRVAIEAASAAAGEYLLLELDRSSGRRGARARLAEDHLVALTGAEDALVTNNNAAAVALAVGLAGRGGGVIVSRGELVEIGGGVRIPEIVRRAGARLIEVGTTNRTRAADVEAALAEGRARVVLRVHPSNFTMAGFTETPDAAAVAEAAHRHGAIVVDDLGSGALLDTAAYGLAHEPLPSERLAAGADLVTFSGDKLVGGPQAGLIVGRSDLVARLRKDPLARAMRPDKVTMAGLTATLGAYRAGRATTDIPVWRMLETSVDSLRARATALVAMLGPATSVAELSATVGGGSLPGETLPSAGVALRGASATRLLAGLRAGEPIVVGRIADDRVVLDLRTVDPEHDAALGGAVERALAIER
jgi:L-seryl-tRNA(Ser) seleniumtransferase